MGKLLAGGKQKPRTSEFSPSAFKQIHRIHNTGTTITPLFCVTI